MTYEDDDDEDDDEAVGIADSPYHIVRDSNTTVRVS